MFVRTYGRRSRSIDRGYSDSDCQDDVVSDGYGDPLSQESSQHIFSFAPFSSQESSHWSFDTEPYASNSSREARELAILPSRHDWVGGDWENGDANCRKLKKVKNGKREEKLLTKKLKPKGSKPGPVAESLEIAGTATLMETQDYGEMMEHMDEVNFALDGLRKGQPGRIRRASLLSLLSICGTAQQRRLLRSHGMAKTIIDAVLGLSLDDLPSNLAAAALFYILTGNGQDDQLLDSPSCIHFMIKLLKPLASDTRKGNASNIGCKLLALWKDVDVLQDAAKGVDSTSNAIMLKVQEILVNCKEVKSGNGNSNSMRKLEPSPKWIALLTMEKACLSTISLEDTSGTVRKTGDKFKEKLRELGGLDAVFEVTSDCHSILERWLKQASFKSQELNANADLESLVLLLKCLKIVENATFLNKDNQGHLLGLKRNSDHPRSPESFIKLIISVITILSGLSLSKNFLGKIDGEKLCDLSVGTHTDTKVPLKTQHKGESDESIPNGPSIRCSHTEWTTSSQKSFGISRNTRWLSASCSGTSVITSDTTSSSGADRCLLKVRANTSSSSSCSGTSRSSYNGRSLSSYVTKNQKGELLEDCQDPFAFDEEEFEPSKWELLSGPKGVKKTQNSKMMYEENGLGHQSQLMFSQQESSNQENCHPDVSYSSAVDEERFNLLADCLLTAVKVLMNLTNDNPRGCKQIAACGGLETLSVLIVGHFPLFTSSVHSITEIGETAMSSKSLAKAGPESDKHLSDQESDLLVAILGLLVNLVEKDGQNRSRLATAIIPLPGLEGLGEQKHGNVIPLLCSIFLENHGAGEAAEEGKTLNWDDEEALLQGEKEAEKMIVQAYAALLLAFLSTESKEIRNAIAERLPDHNLTVLVPVLARFVEFHLTLNMISPETHMAVLEVIESCRMP